MAARSRTCAGMSLAGFCCLLWELKHDYKEKGVLRLAKTNSIFFLIHRLLAKVCGLLLEITTMFQGIS